MTGYRQTNSAVISTGGYRHMIGLAPHEERLEPVGRPQSTREVVKGLLLPADPGDILVAASPEFRSEIAKLCGFALEATEHQRRLISATDTALLRRARQALLDILPAGDEPVDLPTTLLLSERLRVTLIKNVLNQGALCEAALTLVPPSIPVAVDSLVYGTADALADLADLGQRVPTGRNRYAWVAEALGWASTETPIGVGAAFATIGGAASAGYARAADREAASIFSLLSGFAAASCSMLGRWAHARAEPQ